MSTRDASDKQEKIVAKSLGGYQTPNSGATPFVKGDVVVGKVLIECKVKMAPSGSFTIAKSWLDTLEEERMGMGKRAAALAFSFDCGKRQYYVIDEKLMKRLIEVVNGDE